MLKSIIKALGLVVGLALSGIACAVSLGGINVSTALGEPLKAVIALETDSPAETKTLTARMASPDAFKNAGVDYPYGLPLLTFEIEINPASSEAKLKLTSAQPVNEPFVNLLVELNWSSGKLLREYTFLLDPPGYAAELPKLADVQAMEPVVAMPSSEIQPLRDEVKTEPEVVNQAEPVSAEPVTDKAAEIAPVPEPAAKSGKGGEVVDGVITIKRGDTLRKLAAQAKSPDISLERMLVALYRSNADAFDGKNMNRMKTGKILQMPEQSELDNLDQSQALKEIRAQAADWHAYRQKLALASKQVTDAGAPKQEVSGKISTQVEDKTPAVKESAKEVVRLSKGEAPGDKAAAGGSAKAAQDKIDETIARNKSIQESNERVAMLEKNIKAMQRLTELKSQMAADQAGLAAKGASSKLGALPQVQTPASAASDASASSAVPPAKAKPAAEVVAVQPSILDDVLEQPLYLAGLAAALLGLLGLALVRRRRGQGATVNFEVSNTAKVARGAGGASGRIAALFASVLGKVRRKGKHSNSQEMEEVEDIGSASGRISAPVVPSPETGDFTKTLVSTTAISHAPTDDVDPISEADLFLNFGRDEQAEEILKDALSKNPSNYQIHLKLLSIYANRKDVNAFSTVARQVKDSGDAVAWEQAATMGRKLEPNNPMYGGGDGGVTAPAAKEPSPSQMASSDTVIDMGGAKKQELVMDFDLGMATTETPAAASADSSVIAEDERASSASMAAPMDFDITGSHTNISAAAAEDAETSDVQLNDLIFDVTSSPSAGQADDTQNETVIAPEEPEESISYLLDFPAANKSEIASPQTPNSAALDMGLGKISLNLDDPLDPTPAREAEETHDGDIATKLDLAKAYQEMGDSNGAREILEEVVREGNERQRADAEALLQALPA